MKKILILEDEKPNSDRIQRLMLKIRPNIQIVGVLTSVKKTVDWLSENECPDLIIMDIQLADGISFEVFNLADVTCPVIFTTAYDEYAIKAFKYNSIDYLLKPIEKEQLEAAIVKFEKSVQQSNLEYPLIEELIAQIQPKDYRTRFLLPYRDGYKKVSVEDIAFFYSNLNISYAVLFNGEQNVVPHTLETLEQELEPKNFFRVNRQYIVHVNSIEKVHNFFNGKLKLKVKNCADDDLIVSRTKAPLFKTWLDY
ncbi:LytTR family transcriptional regulator [Pedobacter antarcticus 4BY]|uniref:LytTR family transcriptional regulator n=2 Tax=Pedobacter antarcticus TaxID=34086 RepID=A0A081PEA7_9SPHI|nr:LytTR family DNA-binding domain-containing protein [Pedobacter antarcticus]KEQ29030.1 LytTR family transcriptional regulator [Pedobacter antarcticus 4BY]SFE30749.1 two component transcriptional regulator, LytTR family [Pedobacter antarcticus]